MGVGDELLERRERLETAIDRTGRSEDLLRLLGEVDSALARVRDETYGICETCNEPIEEDRLRADPLIRYCIDHLTQAQQRALEHDLETARRVQAALLPEPAQRFAGWQVHYRYEPAGPVSGDYLDLVASERHRNSLFFIVGDVSGKGVAASILMGHLHAMFRTLLEIGVEVQELVQRVNQVFCESTMASHYATVVCGRAAENGEVEFCNAGHAPPLLLRNGTVRRLETTGLPVGMFCSGPYATERVGLEPGDTLVLFTDGLSEARDGAGSEYGLHRLADLLTQHGGRSPKDLATACHEDLQAFRAGAPSTDDLTLLVLQRTRQATRG